MIKGFLERLGIQKPKADTKTSPLTEKNGYVEKEADDSLYDFLDVTLKDMEKHPDAINDMYTGKIDGFLIRNVISSEEVDTLLTKITELKKNKEQLTNVPEGFNYPAVFAEYSLRISKLSPESQAEEVRNYFLNNEIYNNQFGEEFGINIQEFVTRFFTSIAGGRKVEIPQGMDEQGRYLFSTIRYLVPNQGLMSVHCGNYFGQTFEKFYSHLMTKVATKNQMSYFIMLQEPEEGGELSLFNFRWVDGQTKVNAAEDNEVIQPDGSKVYVQTDPSIRKNKLRPQKGDMILFQGGNIWHRVERIKGSIPRITLGGFLGLSHNGNTIYYWS